MATLRSKHAGQAIVEFLVSAMFVIVPLWLAILAIGKFIDMQHSANMASRYAAWERTVWYENTGEAFFTHNSPNQKSADQIRNEIAVRIINDRHSATNTIAADDMKATGFIKGQDPLWQDDSGKLFLEKYDQLGSSITASSLSTDVASKAISAISSINITEFAVGTLVPPVPGSGTLAVASVKFNKAAQGSEIYKWLWSKAAGLPDDWDGMTFESQSAILTNGWAANASKGVEGMVRASLPTASTLGSTLNLAIDGMITVWDPTLTLRGALPDFGRVAPDVVPEDRLR